MWAISSTVKLNQKDLYDAEHDFHTQPEGLIWCWARLSYSTRRTYMMLSTTFILNQKDLYDAEHDMLVIRKFLVVLGHRKVVWQNGVSPSRKSGRFG